MHHLLHQVLQCMCSSGFKAQTDALVNSCRYFRNDTDLVTPTCKYRFDGRTRFFVACKHGNTDRIRLLLQCRANAGADGNGRVPLVAAADAGHVEIVRLLLHAPNVDANHVDAVTEKTALYSASEQGHVAVVRLLCDLAFRDRVDVEQRVRPGEDEDDELGDPFSALHVACRKNHASIVRILLDAGADVYAVGGMDEGIWDAMHADVTIQDDEEFMPQTPLVTAIEAGAAEAIHELFRNRSRPCLPDDCWAILHLAYGKRCLPALPALLSYCAGPSPFIDVVTMGNEYGRALRTAVYRRIVEAVRLLLEIPHTDIWEMDEDGGSAWSLAIGDCDDNDGTSSRWNSF